MNETRKILEDVAAGKLSVDAALTHFKAQPFEDLGYAKVDLHRRTLQGASEVIYGEGKTTEQIAGIARSLAQNGQRRILITRLDAQAADEVKSQLGQDLGEMSYNELARVAIIGGMPEPDGAGSVLVVCAGTSDIPVAEEAALTACAMGNEVERAYDVGVAGLHRTLSSFENIANASVIVAVAGMEGALASVVGGLAACPVIAVPTSVGYGASFDGLAALLAMLNSCASGVSVVNIDNGFGGGYMASLINHVGVKS